MGYAPDVKASFGSASGFFYYLKEEMMKGLLISRKFWAAVLMVIVVILNAAIPSFELDTEHVAGLAVVIVSYLVGVAVDPGPGDWRGVIKSRKFWAAAVGFVILFLDGFGIGLPLGLNAEQLVLIAVTIGGYIAGVALEGPPFESTDQPADEPWVN